MDERAKKEAFVTLATNDTYALGCLVLGNSLRRTKTSRKLVVMITDGITSSMRNQLERVFDLIHEVDLLDSKDSCNLALLGRPDLSCTFTKLHCWRLTQFDKAVFLDADTLVLQSVDELFDREELSASPDAGWPDCFNSGVFVFKPSEETYSALRDFALAQGSFDGGDQGLLNLFFRDWATKDIARHLPFIYNVVSQAFYSYLPAFTQFKNDIKIVHFIGQVKPWHHAYNTSTGQVLLLPESGHNQNFLQLWWDLFMQNVQPALDPALTHLFTAPQPSPNYQSAITGEDQHFQPDVKRNGSSSYKIMFPYVPPSLDVLSRKPASDSVISHNPSQSSCSQNDSLDNKNQSPQPSQIIEITDFRREYHVYETHYVEGPISNIDADAQHCEAWDLEQSLKLNVEDEQTTCISDSESANTNPQTQDIEETESSKAFIDQLFGSVDLDELGGLVGELASLQIKSGDHSVVFLDDQERKLAWERGQMDYLGVDSFENIKRKLDSKIVERSPSPVSTRRDTSTSSPSPQPVNNTSDISSTSNTSAVKEQTISTTETS